MSKVFIEESTLIAIGDAIRAKNGSSELIAPQDMDTAITNLPTGGDTIPDEAFSDWSSNDYRFFKNTSNWMLDNYPNRFETLSGGISMFQYNYRQDLPITIKLSAKSMGNMFDSCYYLESITNFEEPDAYNSYFSCNSLFSKCYRLQTLPDTLFGTKTGTSQTVCTWDRSYIFNSCYSLKDLPQLKTLINVTTTSPLYYGLASYCYALNKIINLPVTTATFTSNKFNDTVKNCFRLKEFTFETNEDGTPKTANWKSQTINLASYVGWTYDTTLLTQYNADVYGRVTDDANYETYKNTEKWYTSDVAYSRYNRTSAINTINSLPDTSAYLAENGGTNTIKFKSDAGRLTDGGRIDLLGEAQIAAAAAKGWTIAFVESI